MGSVERVMTALALKQPDRVPVMEFVVDEAVARRAAPGCRDAADAMDRLGMDAVACGAVFRRTAEHADGTYTDEWGVRYKPGPEAVAHPLDGSLRTAEDVEAYVPPDPAAPWRLEKLRELVSRYKGRRAICFHHRAAFMWSAYLLGIDNLLANFLLEPELVDRLMDKVLAANVAVVRNAIRAGAEVIVLGDDYADNRGPLFSPAHFERFVLPRLKAMIDAIHDEGAKVIKHSDGNLYPLLDMIADAGPDGLNPIEPAAGMSLAEVKRRVGGKVCLVGNIDCAQLLPFGSREQVEAAVRQAIADAAAGGGFILASSNSIHSSCRAENVVEMVRAGQVWGCYNNQQNA
jgi:uroporphyrinogen decarboxylase